MTKKETVARVGASNPLLGGLPMRLWFVFTVVGRIARIDARGRRAYPSQPAAFLMRTRFVFSWPARARTWSGEHDALVAAATLGVQFSIQQ